MKLVVCLLAAALLAGCLASDPETNPIPTGNDEATLVQQSLAGVPVLDFDASAAIDWWEDVATNYPKHDSNTPTNQLLRSHLVSEMERIGLDVEVRSYAAQPRGVPLPDTGQDLLQYHVLIGTKVGPLTERIGVVAHYDTQTMTIHGAYDDASGVAAQFHICQQLMQVPLNHTLSCIFFDAEEQGLIGSQAYTEDAVVSGEHVYDYVLGYDMTGINWPGHDWKMYMMTGPVDDVPWLQAVGKELMHDVLGYPETGVEVLDVHDRNSDERRFKELGIPIYRFAGGRNAADYDAYHRYDDTVQHVYDTVDGRANFEAGFTTIVEASYYTILALDAQRPDDWRAAYF